MKKLLIIQTSLNKDSKTRIIAQEAFSIADKVSWLDVEFLDLKDYQIEFCNWKKIEEYNSDMNKIKEIVELADYYILAYPVYNYSFSWVCKNFIDIFSYYMDSKPCVIIQNSYSIRSFSDWYWELAKVLGLHNNIKIILPMVHSFNDDFKLDKIINIKVIEKLKKSISNLLK